MYSDKEIKRNPKQQKQWEKRHKYIDGIDHKLCNSCKEWLPSNTDCFYKNKGSSIDGLHSYCKECTRKKSIEYRNANLEKCRRSEYKRYKENKEEYDARRKEWIRDNPERTKEYHKVYRKKNAKYFSDYSRQRRQNKTHKITNTEWFLCKKYFNHSCAYCGMSEEASINTYQQELHKEHVNHEGSNDLSNCVPACKGCNSSKWAHPVEEWYLEQEFYDTTKWKKINKWLKEDYKLYIDD